MCTALPAVASDVECPLRPALSVAGSVAACNSRIHFYTGPLENDPIFHLLADFCIMTSQSNGPSNRCAIMTSQCNVE